MPIYEYKCAECGFQEEFLQKHSDPQLTVCPSCGKEAFKKMLSAAGFQLKGSGWYATDFKSSGSKPAAKSEGDAKPEGNAKPESSGTAEKSSGDAGADKSTGDKPAEKTADKSTAAAKTVPASTSG